MSVDTAVNSAAEKRHRLREAGLWRNTPKYYSRPYGFVEVNPIKANERRWQIEKRSGFIVLASVFAGNIVIVERQEQFIK